MFDEEPNDPHYECGLEIHGLKTEVERLTRELAEAHDTIRCQNALLHQYHDEDHKAVREQERLKLELANLRKEVDDIPGLSRNAIGLRLILKPGEWKRRIEVEDADTSELGQDVALFVLLAHRDRKELLRLRSRISDWTNRMGCQESKNFIIRNEMIVEIER